MRFCSKNRKGVKGSVTEVAKIMGARWGKLSEAKKNAFNEPAGKEMKAWRAKFEKYKKTSKYRSFDAKRKEANAKKKRAARIAPKDPNRPKAPTSAYLFFAKDQAKKGKSFQVIGKAWGKLTKKDKWEKMAQKSKADFDAAMEKYKSSAKYRAHQKVVEKFKANLKPTPAQKKAAAKSKAYKAKIERQKARTAKKKAHKKQMAANKAERKKKSSAKKKAKKEAQKERAKAKREAAAKKRRAKKSKRKAKRTSKKKTAKRTSKKRRAKRRTSSRK